MMERIAEAESPTEMREAAMGAAAPDEPAQLSIGTRDPAIDALDPAGYEAAIPGLAALIVDAVQGGASVNFMRDLTESEAAAWLVARVPDVADGTISAFVARDSEIGTIVGSTILIRSRNTNAPHRAEIGKVLVHRKMRRRGLGRALMEAAEARAKADGRWLLILDTEAGSAADTFYRSLGWQVLGTMPNHAYRSDGQLAPTTYFWKDLRGNDVSATARR
ncbi:MAG TPA: GNAT family N-acetyltransferase [Candidatus Limnocylindrales bacterium]|nr:GNAT family N-acetyltransferase [Candidatus Limnocylindrales bacterium]